MADNLQRYRKKRDFSITAEPRGGKPTGGQLSFVVQKHAARRLHYDFRLELDGTLKSWAVPKGPSLDPADKRMAVHVEDHPIDYGGFEGVIPPGQYGAGTVIVWDRGEWRPVDDPREAYKAGKLKFDLHGEKLHGRWTLVRMRGRENERQEPWLLIKERDEAARAAADFDVVEQMPDSVLKQAAAGKKRPRGKAGLPLSFSPMLATLVDKIPEGDWLYEIKFDGYRLLARIEGQDVRLFTRNGHDWTSKLKKLAQELAGLGMASGWLDGEIVVLDDKGIPDFQLLQNAFDSTRTQNIVYYLFDLPYHEGRDLRDAPLRERRALLRGLLDRHSAAHLRYSEDFAAEPRDMLNTACKLRMEGLIAKKADSVYSSRRSPNWLKLKCTQRQEFVIGGYTDPKGSRVGLGSLLLGVHDEQGHLRYAGNVGSGFNTKLLGDLTAKLDALRTDKSPFHEMPQGIRMPGGKPKWVRPKLVAEVSFGEWTKAGRIRHSAFHGLRTDKPARAITEEKPVPVTKRRKTVRSDPLPVKITNPGRVIDASSGITKMELVEYYAKVAKRILPHLDERPVSLVRGPDGLAGQLIFQKHGAKVKGIKQLDRRFDPEHAPLLEVDSLEALIGCAQQNVIEFHTWNGTTRAIDQPDRMTFDLDPGEGVKWPAVREAAELVRALLEELGLKSFLKTSGGKGLHVIAPIRPDKDWDTVKDFSRAVVEHLARHLPRRFVAKSGPKNRVGRIFVDYLRNGRGATTVAAWSARARPGIGVSVPVAWAELEGLSASNQWNIRNIDERLELANPWATYGAAKRQGISKAMKALKR